MESTDKRMKIQSDNYENVQKAFTNYKKSPRERITLGYVNSRLESLEDYWREFRSLHQKIVQDISEKDKECLPYFEQEVYDKFEELYYTYKGELRNALQKFQPEIEKRLEQQSENVSKQHNDIMLPRIVIPTFDGNYTEWQSFHDLFLALIHKNDSLENVQKLHYLKSNLKGDAEILLRQFAITGENYAEAWSMLKKRYDNKRYIANCIFKKFFSQKCLSYESANLLKQLLDTSMQCLNAMKNLGLPTTHWDAIVNYVIVSKLDTATRKQWEESIGMENSDNLPSFEQLKTFLETRFRMLEMVEPVNKINKPVNTKSFHSTANNKNLQCPYCKEEHYIYNCKRFVKQPVDERYKFVQKHNLCFNCLIPNHSVYKCKQTTSCKICRRRHHSLLHKDREQLIDDDLKTKGTALKEEDNKEEKITAHVCNKQPGQIILLATAQVGVTSRSGETHVFRALIDQGSEASFVTARVVDLLGLRRKNINGVVSGIGEENRLCIKYMSELEIKSRYENNFSVKVKAYVLKSLTRRLPVREVKGYNWPQLNDLMLADPNFYLPGRIDILLGADVFCKIIDSGLLRGPGNLIAQPTHLGWIISGDIHTTTQSPSQMTSLHITDREDETNNLLRKFWEIESGMYTNKKIYTQEESKCEEIFKETTTREETGRYVVHLPLKQSVEDTINMCGDTKKLAIARLELLERKFSKNEAFKEEYTKVLQEYLQLGHMRKVEDVGPEKAIYLAHHAVIREDKDTTKLRVVFDASAKGENGHSLNDCMMIGPTIQPDLCSLIIRWRSHKICVIGDIVKMYRQVKVTEQHTDLQRIVWRDNKNEEIRCYKLLTVTFGTAAAPYLAVRTLHQLAIDEAVNYPRAAPIIQNSCYMDDLMTGNEDIFETKSLCKEINELLKKGGFEMQKWSSNSEEVLEHLRKERETKDMNEIDIKLDTVIKILGLIWDRKDDIFKITVNLPEVRNPITKRSILSEVASLFDPFGWLSPVIITAKILIQKLWLCSLGWDDELPCELVNEWLCFREQLQELQAITIPRWLCMSKRCREIQLHGFADASALAYAAVVYVRTVDRDGLIHVTLIASKTKVAPLKQLSIPKLELCAAVLLAKLLHNIAGLLDIKMNSIYAWTDSMIVLSWLQAQPSKWQVFVGNRVSDIIQHIDNDRWRHVQSNDNPADLASRGVQAKQLNEENIWWMGPEWLKYEVIEFTRSYIPQSDLEIKKVYHSHSAEELIWTRFSSLSRMRRVLSYCRRWLLSNKQKKDECLTASELNLIELRCVKFYQELIYENEIECLKKDGRVRSTSSLVNLTPYLDEHGLLRVTGRLSDATYLLQNFKHPIIIPAKQHITKLIIREAHFRTFHGGILQMITYIRQRYWIINLRSAVRGVIRECAVCIRDTAKTRRQLMGQLPESRVTPNRAFLNSGVDYAGPIQIRLSKGRGCKSSKGYICLFVCMSTKAIHLEAVTELTSVAFIAAFRRFVARRGHCSNLWSDNGTNFVGAARELRTMFEVGKSNVAKEIAELLANDGTTWHFIPPKAPNFGGLWEAGVKSAKRHLTRINSNTKLTYEEMSTLLAQIEACLNSRPLSHLDDTLDTLIPLTPGHFLIGEPIIGLPENDYLQKDINLLTRWQLLQKQTQDFWRRWQSEYLHSLQQRYKWQRVVPSPSVGDIVILKEEELPPCKWLLGRVVALHPGNDNLVRVVSVKCRGNIVIKRPLSKVIPLPSKPESCEK